KDWAMRFCQLLLAENLQVTWQIPSGTRSEALDAEVLGLMVRSGCTNFTYAPESGDEDVLRRIKKRIHKDRMLDSMRAAVRAGCNVKANFILGFPDETRAAVLRTFGFLAQMAVAGVHDVSIAPLRPYPGSEIFRDLQAQGVIPTPLDDAYYRSLASG